MYLDHNSGSHFRPLADSVRIYAPLLKFLGSSFAAFLVDTAVFLLLTRAGGFVAPGRAGGPGGEFRGELPGQPAPGVRARQATAGRSAGLRYFSLVAVLLAANVALIWALEAIAVPALPAKVLAEIMLLAISFSVQQRFLFARKQDRRPPWNPQAAAAGNAAGEPPSKAHIPG